MAEREELLIALYRELVGPRGGINEILAEEHDPKNEYIMGVLAPRNVKAEPDIDAESEIITEDTFYDEEDDISKNPIMDNTIISPALDPKSLPRSMGLSFCIANPKVLPEIEVIITWARYSKDGVNWVRKPEYFLTGAVIVRERLTWDTKKGVLLEMRGRNVSRSDNKWRISLFLVNNTEIPADKKPQTEDHIFQPQIRVNIKSGHLEALDKSPFNKNNGSHQCTEDDSLRLLYRNKPTIARGHLTGATWKEIDPERPHPTIPLPQHYPFFWEDGEIVPKQERDKFSPAAVRTEYLPSYPVVSPDMEWDKKYGPPPELNPQALSECWKPDQIEINLRPLVAGYKNWLSKLRRDSQVLIPQHELAVKKHLGDIERTMLRIEEALNLLKSDEDIRLSFCFANKVMALQSGWARNGRVFDWRPFQLAFILLNIPSVSIKNHNDRNICDLLWFPTGGGKTEAYLGLAAFTLALRRRRAPRDSDGLLKGSGLGVISRYTLRLLTIQQFRRALRMITACEYLRVMVDNSGLTGWRPSDCKTKENYPWGTERFSVGLWVGGGVTPNHMLTNNARRPDGTIIRFFGAIDILTGNPQNAEGEPAQVLRCPCCNSHLAVPNEGFLSGSNTLHFVFKSNKLMVPEVSDLLYGNITINNVSVFTHSNPSYHTLSVQFTVPPNNVLKAQQVDEWWENVIKPKLGKRVELQCARPSRPGYFIRYYLAGRHGKKPVDFEIYCPNPDCELNRIQWAEKVPIAIDTQVVSNSSDMEWQEVLPAFQVMGSPRSSSRIPIPAHTIDDQVYHRIPSLLVATVDKFARLSFEPRASSIFGNVDHYHARWGYYRKGCPPNWGYMPDRYLEHPPGFGRKAPLHKQVSRFESPDLILQDELHLIEGPLGSMVGIYETAIDTLCTKKQDDTVIIPKYIASTATVREARTQVQSIFARKLGQFPPPGLCIEDNFFSRMEETHPLDSNNAGRLYVGICPPGKGAQTPIVRIWSVLLQTCQDLLAGGAKRDELDRFWTLVGYFNAIRELAGASSLYRQDIPERIRFMAGSRARDLNEALLELSGRCNSLELPGMLERLENNLVNGNPENAVLATSMFGTGVDVDRLGLMVVHGQPKTTASYIQATGRVGRQRGGLVVTFLRASRPRDLDHYEYFTGYHRALYRNVEPVSVAPFSPRARERSIGPLAVAILRQGERVDGNLVDTRWKVQQRLSGGTYVCHANLMRALRLNPEVAALARIFEERARNQPPGRRVPPGVIARELDSELDRWASLSGKYHDRLLYHEPSMLRPPERPVVLGDPQHQMQNLAVAYKNAPGSLRDVESTTRFSG
ncbi:helicase [Desulfallas sp. Bu1-1]|uniref:DISARM system helicase DrmA n=1 Tax=Desulfallas sp. Bu1-1 TaxID=2787620 RepID=UPI00189C63CB|nr:DISARM system helicase DrmA [Desulfallas sp. Bu1-1]MBF7084351.1 helicase [Desulfallas sp. Bu1-1]